MINYIHTQGNSIEQISRFFFPTSELKEHVNESLSSLAILEQLRKNEHELHANTCIILHK